MNYLLDTCTVSELRKGARANAGLAEWARETKGRYFISAVTLMELENGIVRAEIRDPTQGALLRRWLNEWVLTAFSDRILPFDADAAIICAKLHVPDNRPERDAMIAAIAIANNHPVVTRNVKDFKGMKGLTLINPWKG